MNRWLSAGVIATLGMLTGCSGTPDVGEEVGSTAPGSHVMDVQSDNGFSALNGFATANGFGTINGFGTLNGFATVNGFQTLNGVPSANVPWGTNGYMSTAAGREMLTYIVKCALPSGHTLWKQDQYNNWYGFNGQLGMAPEWETGSCDMTCQEYVSACLMAHVNTAGVHVPIWIDSPNSAIGWGQNSAYPNEEGTFMGNLFLAQPKAYYCHGRDYDKGTVPGRIGVTTGTNLPYKDLYAGTGWDTCDANCTASDARTNGVPDGYKACSGWNNTVTVYRAATTCGAANENQVLSLACPRGETIATVVFASYGTPSGSCGSLAKGWCNAGNSMSVVQSACVGKESCSIQASNSTFGDPCYGTGKRLYAQVTCL